VKPECEGSDESEVRSFQSLRISPTLNHNTKPQTLNPKS